MLLGASRGLDIIRLTQSNLFHAVTGEYCDKSVLIRFLFIKLF
jgi:hypothetical protein